MSAFDPYISQSRTRSPIARGHGLGATGVLIALGCLTLVAPQPALAGESGTGRPSIQEIGALRQAGESNPEVRAWGLDPANANALFTSPLGVKVSVVRGSEAACLLLGHAGEFDGSESCASDDSIEEGRATVINNNCSVGTVLPMQIAGLAPKGATQVKVPYNTGKGLSGTVVGGAFLIESRTPTGNEPYPTALQFLDGKGNVVASEVERYGNDLCLTPDPPAPSIVGANSKRGTRVHGRELAKKHHNKHHHKRHHK